MAEANLIQEETGAERMTVLYNYMANGVNAAGSAVRDEVAVAAAIAMLVINLEPLHPGLTLRRRIVDLLEHPDA